MSYELKLAKTKIQKIFPFIALLFVITSQTVLGAPADDFVIQVKTDNAGNSSDTEFTVGTNAYSDIFNFNYNIDCNNDGVNEATAVTGNYTCDYNNLANGAVGGAGIYTIRIKDNSGERTGFPQIYLNGGHYGGKDPLKIISLDQWGTGKWLDLSFNGASNMLTPATDTPDFSRLKSMFVMFGGASLANPDTTHWDTSAVRDMEYMFHGATSANPDTTNWDTSSVMDMGYMFFNASSANPNTSNWDISNVALMENMFFGVSLPTESYDAMLIGFNAQNLKPNVNFHGGNSKYCNAEAARTNMKTQDDWGITDGGKDCSITFSWDIDGDGQVKPLTDGLLVLRYLFSFTGNALIDNAVDANATRTTATEIEDVIQEGINSGSLDIDNNGEVKPLTDGLILLRYLFSFTGQPLVANAIGPNATRSTATAVQTYLMTEIP